MSFNTWIESIVSLYDDIHIVPPTSGEILLANKILSDIDIYTYTITYEYTNDNQIRIKLKNNLVYRSITIITENSVLLSTVLSTDLTNSISDIYEDLHLNIKYKRFKNIIHGGIY